VVDNSLSNAVKNDKSFRVGMPIGYQHFGGLCDLNKSLTPSNCRQEFENQIKLLITKLKDHMDLDHAIDEFALNNYYMNSLPPSITNGKLSY